MVGQHPIGMIKHITFLFRFSSQLCSPVLWPVVWSSRKCCASRSFINAPENTLASTVKAIELGVDRIEMDVRQSKDGVLVLMHDVALNAQQMARAIYVTLLMKNWKFRCWELV